MGRTACTEPQCLYNRAVLLPSYGPYDLYRAPVPVQLSYTSIPPIGRTACRASVPVQYSYTSTPPIARTACTEPQCLYSTPIPLLPLLPVRPVQNLSACTVQLYLYSPYCPYGLYRASVPVQ